MMLVSKYSKIAMSYIFEPKNNIFYIKKMKNPSEGYSCCKMLLLTPYYLL